MNDKIQSVLQPGETVKWSGRPENVKLMEAPYGVTNVIRFVCAVLIIGAGYWLTGPGAGETIDHTQSMVFLGACVIIGLYLLLDPIFVANKMKNQTSYYITDRRVITCYKKGDSVKIKMRMLDELDEVSVDKLSNGNSVIYLGKKSKNAARLARTQFAFTDVQDKEDGIPLMFYSVHDTQNALASLPAGLCR